MGEHEETPEAAVVTIGRISPDGSGVIRRWYVHACCAESLVAQLGPLDAEVLTTPEARAAVHEHTLSTPGVVIVPGERHG